MIAWTAAVVLAVLSWRRLAWGYSSRGDSHPRLARREVAFLEAVAEATFPAGGAIPVSGIEADLPQFIDSWFAILPATQRRQIRALFLLFEQASLIFPATGRGRFRRFSALTPEQRICVLRRWSESRFFLRRLLFTAIRAVITFGYLADKRVTNHLGLSPRDIESPICAADLIYPRVGCHPDSIPYTHADLTAPSDGTPIPLDAPLHPDWRGVES